MTGGDSASSLGDLVTKVMQQEYARAERLVRDGDRQALFDRLPAQFRDNLVKLGSTRHNGRGILLTLFACKAAHPDQDIRSHKSEHLGGFNARGLDTHIVVPLLREWSLHSPGESHWLTQVFSGQPFDAGQVLKTQPKFVGRIVPGLIAAINHEPPDVVNDAICTILVQMILERNQSQIPLTKPKRLTIARAIRLLEAHFGGRYKTGGPRLPQLAIYSAYERLIIECKRYEEHALVPIERLKTANRKSGTVGDVDVLHGDRTVEAVEIKSGMAITSRHVSDAIEKIKAADVARYYILSTEGVAPDHSDLIADQTSDFYFSNGCEIIVNGVFETITYYLRLIGSVDEFIACYVDHLSSDPDLSYEHRIAWNKVCEDDGSA